LSSLPRANPLIEIRARRSGMTAIAAVATAIFLIVLAALAAPPALLRRPFAEAVIALSAARPLWLWAAGGCFAASLFCSAAAWRSGLAACGERIGPLDATARYSVGSLVNSLLPGHAGGATRLALFSRSMASGGRVWRTSGIAATVGTARAIVLVVLVLAASASGALPLWPVFILAGIAAAGAIAAIAARGHPGTGRKSQLLEAFGAFGRSPRRAAWLLGWVAGGTVARLGATAAIVTALGVPTPLAAALVIVPALAVAGTIQFGPANVGVTTGVVALALHSRGVALPSALASGLALQSLETAASLAVGLTGAAFLAFPSPAGRRWTFAASGACACVLSVAFGAMAVDTLA
jgi:uncharacterized membrane protein YbhN (UPF0104 family)